MQYSIENDILRLTVDTHGEMCIRDRAYSAFEKCATQDLLTDVAEYSMRIVSGEHDEPSQVSPKDDMRAGRIVDDLERLGIVEEFAGSKPRKINHTELEKVIPK